ncbi:hypothetical protein ACVXHB_24075 [Escherichia coli]
MNGNSESTTPTTMVVMSATAKTNRYPICRSILLTVRWTGNRWRWKTGDSMFLGTLRAETRRQRDG